MIRQQWAAHAARSSRASRTLAAMALGYLPGFALPFLISGAFPRGTSDATLLAISTSTTLGSILSLAYENSWTGFMASKGGRNPQARLRQVRQGERQAFFVGLATTAVLLPCYATLFARANIEASIFIPALLCIAPYPVLSAITGVLAGAANANGRLSANLLLQGVRSSIPVSAVAILLAFRLDNLSWVVTLAVPLGELVRILLLRRVNSAHKATQRSPSSDTPGETQVPTARSILHHVGALAILGFAPILDRLFLAHGTPGTVTQFELADKVFFAANQVATTLLVIRRAPAIALALAGPDDRKTMRRELRRAGTGAGAATLASILPVTVVLLIVPTNSIYHGAAIYSLLLLASLPASVASTLLTRLIVTTGRSSWLPATSGLGLVLDVLGNLIGWQLLGTIGVVGATSAYRYALVGASVWVLWRPQPGWRRQHRNPSAL